MRHRLNHYNRIFPSFISKFVLHSQRIQEFCKFLNHRHNKRNRKYSDCQLKFRLGLAGDYSKERRRRGTDIGRSCRDDYRRYIDDQVGDIETANRVGNVREVARLTKALTGRGKHHGNIMPTKDVDGKPLTESKQLLDAWQEFLGRKFTCADLPGAAYAPVTADDDDGEVTEEELETCLRVLHDNKAPGCDGIPIEAYR